MEDEPRQDHDGEETGGNREVRANGLSRSTERVESAPVLDLNHGPFLKVAAEVGWNEALRRRILYFFRSNWGNLSFVMICALGLMLLGMFSFDSLPWRAWLSLGVVVLMFSSLIDGRFSTHIPLMAALFTLTVFGAVNVDDALEGFGNTGVVAVAVLFTVAEGVQRTALLEPVFRLLLGRPRRIWQAQLRLCIPVALASALLSDTPVVVMMIPVVLMWSRRSGFSASKLLLPMNYAVILGGVLTLFGTSTNILLASQVSELNITEDYSADGKKVVLGVFGSVPVGVPQLLIGIAYILLASPFLLKDRLTSSEDVMEYAGEYTVELRVSKSSSIVGETVSQAGLLHLKGGFLIEIERPDGEIISAVSADSKIETGDTLIFAGVVETVRELFLIPGLVPASDQTGKLEIGRHCRRLVEVVISTSSPLSGHSVKESRFRTRFGAAIVAVQRHGERVRDKIGEIVLRGGDTLLLETGDDFVVRFGRNRNFALVVEVRGSLPPRESRLHMVIAAVTIVAMVGCASARVAEIVVCAAVASLVLIATGCSSVEGAGNAVNYSVLITIACSFGVSNALRGTGAAAQIASVIVTAFGGRSSELGALFAIYITTVVMTSLITESAAVLLMLPIVADRETGIAAQTGVNIYAALYATMLAANASFSTPVAYQTNLMVHGPGGYTFMDWVRFGIPLQCILAVSSVFLCYFFYR